MLKKSAQTNKNSGFYANFMHTSFLGYPVVHAFNDLKKTRLFLKKTHFGYHGPSFGGDW